MKSVGEAMALGRTFKQAFAQGAALARARSAPSPPQDDAALLDLVQVPGADRFDFLLEALRRGDALDELYRRTSIDPWFLRELSEYVADPEATFAGERTFKAVDTCAAEFAAQTPYFYSGWERARADAPRRSTRGRRPSGRQAGRTEPRGGPGERPGIVILGSGPNRIGQGIEFDYCCVHAAQTVARAGARRDHDQLQPGDGLDRLRHLRPAVLRAADARGRDRGLRARATRGSGRPVRRPDAAEARRRPRSGRDSDPRHPHRRDRPRRGSRPVRRAARPPRLQGAAVCDRHQRRARRSQRAPEVGFPLLVRPATCSAAARWRSSTASTACATT